MADRDPSDAPVRLVNARRGEVALAIGGRTRILCLTFGGLAQLETAYGVRDLGALARRLRALTSADLPVLLSALLIDEGPKSPAILARAALDPMAAASAIAAAFDLAFEARQ